MSKYKQVLQFISTNRNSLLKLDKFKDLNNESSNFDFLMRMKIRKEDMLNFLSKNEDKIILFETKKLVLVSFFNKLIVLNQVEDGNISKEYLSNIDINLSTRNNDYYFNDGPLRILNFYTDDHSGKFNFRREVSKMIIGKKELLSQDICEYFLDVYYRENDTIDGVIYFDCLCIKTICYSFPELLLF